MTRSSRRHALAAASAAIASLGLITTFGASGATAADEDPGVEVVNTETVQVDLDDSGSVDSQRIYEQLTLSGQGPVDLRNPIETDGLRNLNGFSVFDVKDGAQEVKATVDGVEHLRSVSDFKGYLPLEVSVAYLLDGEPVEPGDLVGASGGLEVLYTVRNASARSQEIEVPDGRGGSLTTGANVPIPIVGALATTVPANFTDVTSEDADMAGDGEGGTTLSFTMVLFPPLGSEEATFGYAAEITDGLAPSASITALPVNPLDRPTFRRAAEGYRAGAAHGEEMVSGLSSVDADLLQLRDGAADLLSGLVDLRQGADNLDTGLRAQAAPAAGRVASGARGLDDSVGQVTAGVGTLIGGVDRLAAANGAALDGTRQLGDGLRRISAGLGRLADNTQGLPGAVAGARGLRSGIDQLLAQVGTVATPGSLLYAVDQLAASLPGARDQSRGLAGRVQGAAAGLPGAKATLDGAKARVDTELAPGSSLARIRAGLDGLLGTICAADPLLQGRCTDLVNPLIADVDQVQASLTTASTELGNVSAGLAGSITALNDVVPSLSALADQLTAAAGNAQRLRAQAPAVRGGLVQVRSQIDRLESGLASAVGGVSQLYAGSRNAVASTGDLTSGLSRLTTGTGQLADGARQVREGAGRTRQRARDIAGGAGSLTDRLRAAADGSNRLTGGFQRAAERTPQLVDGAGRLSRQELRRLIKAGEHTARHDGEMYAVLEAGAERAQTEAMPYGAPEGAEGITAYQFELAGNDGESGRNVARGLAALVLLAGIGAIALRRRLI